MLSDGRVISRALAKMSCIVCGSAFHASKTADEDIRAIYAEDYTLAAAAPKSDAARARAYANWIRAECSPPRAVLEIGCGSGALVSELARSWPGVHACGVDPALPETALSQPNTRFARGFVESVPADAGPFDLIISVNVIEHTTDPVAFLRSLRSHLAPRGRIVVICPNGNSPNVELLFFDHLYSLTQDALRTCGGRARLAAERQSLAPKEIGDFQMTIFADAADDRDVALADGAESAELHSERQAYLERWQMLDQSLLYRSRSATELVAFGAGQTAALLRAYAPETWMRVGSLVLDDPAEAWNLERPIASYRDVVQNPGQTVLVAVTPHAQEAVGRRLKGEGFHPITWNELIPR
jgi:SAM-dependent methyltransferase